MQLRRETNIYDDEAVARSIASVNNKVEKTYGTCTTAAATVAKVVALDGFVLFTGAQITVKFSYANTAASPTLNVNGTGAKPIWARGAAILPQYYWSTSCVQHFTYDGSHWVMENAESQEETYKRLTNNSQNTGLYLENGSLYLNASYVNTGALSITKNGSEVFYANVDTGVVRISGSSISITAGDTVDTAIDNAVNEVKASYGTCSTAAATAAKVVTLSKFALYTGAKISVKFTYANTAASPTLNVNGTGAKTIRAFNASLTASSPYNWRANSIVEFVYDGTYWQLAANYDQQEIFNRLTNNQSNQGIYLSGGNLYINASMINTGTLSASRIYGGTLTLGGANNVNGYCIVKDSSGNEVIRINNSGIIMKNNTLSKRVEMNNVGLSFFDTLDDQTKVMDVTCNPASGSSVRGIKFYKNYLFLIGKGSDSGDVGQMAFDTSALALQHYTKVSLQINGTDYSFQKAGMTASSGYISAKQFKTHEILLDSGSQLAIGTSSNSVWVKGAFTASGTKSRSATTKDYGERLLYCYETPSPVFGDIGEGVISDDGKCYVWIDNIFAETVTLNQYQVFLQKYGDGDCWVSAKTPVYFVVEGTPNMSFGWEIKAKQSDFDQLRLEKNVGDFEIRNSMDYAEDLISHIEDIRSEREVA